MNKAKVKNKNLCDNLILENEANLNVLINDMKKHKKSILEFDSEIRNKINHGCSISVSKEKVFEIVESVLNSL